MVEQAAILLSRASWSEQGTGKRLYTSYGFVHPDWRRRGLASHLLAQSIWRFHELGMEETALGAETQHPFGALQLHEGVGYREIARFTTFNREMRPQLSER